MSFYCNIYVEEKTVYSGDFKEVPEKFRIPLIEALQEWADCMGKSGLNEMIYSFFTWYDKSNLVCKKCNLIFEDQKKCTRCDGELKIEYFYERNSELDFLLTCIGMITKVEICSKS